MAAAGTNASQLFTFILILRWTISRPKDVCIYPYKRMGSFWFTPKLQGTDITMKPFNKSDT